MTEPTYGGLTASQIWQAIAEAGAGAAEMSIKPLVLAALLRAIEPIDKFTIAESEIDRFVSWHEKRETR